jgi:opacity protein-like surface antigen
VLDFGAGISYNYFKIEAEDIDADADDWLFGGQVFADINYKINKDWFIGINGKYQFTDDLEFDNIDTSTNANNWRVGAQVGLMF